MQNRVSKQIKLTDAEFQAFSDLSDSSPLPSAKQYLDHLIEMFIDTAKKQTESVINFLTPSKSGIYRTVWIDPDVFSMLRTFATDNDVSQNAVIFTVVKNQLIATEAHAHAQ